MLLLEAFHIRKQIGDRLLFQFDSLKVYSGDKIGVIGANGAGKTTLLDVLSGEMPADEGSCRRYGDIAYIRQFSQEKADAAGRLLREFELAGKTGRPALSGGEQERLRIADALSADNLLLLADEPTSNLDGEGVRLLTEKLAQTESFLLVSHDRSLLDTLCNRMIEIENGNVRFYDGNYSDYRRARQARTQRAQVEYAQYTQEKARLENALEERKRQARSVKKAPSRMGNSEARLYRRAAGEKQEKIHNAAKSIETRLEKLEVKEKPRKAETIRLDFSLTDPPMSPTIVESESLSFGYGENEIFRRAAFRIPRGSKTAIVGPNGAGKTTLLTLIGNRAGPVRCAPKARFGVFRQDLSNIRPERSVLENARRDSVQNENAVRAVLARLLFREDDVHKPAGVLSGGERIKLSLAMLIVSGCNVLLLDEPTNYLDLPSMEAVQQMLREYEGSVLLVSHDRVFVDAVADRLLILEDKAIRTFDGSLSAYEQGRKNPAPRNGNARMLLEMRLAQLAFQIGRDPADKAELEEAYRKTAAEIQALRQDSQS